MIEIRRTPRQWVLLLLMALASMLFMSFLLQVLLAMQAGATVDQAISLVLHTRTFWLQIGILVAVFTTIFLLMAILIERRAGRRLQTMRLITIIGALPFLLIAPYLIARALISGEWENSFWFLVIIWVIALVALISQWRIRYDPDRQEAIETGDFSRIRDERFYQVQGRSANTTINVLLVTLFFGGVFYDIVVTRMWPYRTFGEVLLILIIFSIASWWWNRKL